MLAAKEKIMGFGHAVYTLRRPKNEVIKKIAKRLSVNYPHARLFEISQAIEETMWQEKKLFPNLDFYKRRRLSFYGRADAAFYAAFCHLSSGRIGRRIFLSNAPIIALFARTPIISGMRKDLLSLGK